MEKLIIEEFELKRREEIEEKYLNRWVDGEWSWNEDGSVNAHDVTIYSIDSCKKIPVKFNKIERNFLVSNLGLETLENCPDEVGQSFWCQANNLTSLEYAPKIVGEDFECYGNLGNFTIKDVEKVCKVSGNIIV